MPPQIFPLRWESTGDQWWYASPIDCAAANGLYDVVLELLHQDTNLLVKLTSLRRIRRLETVWDDGDGDRCHVALNRSRVARKLLEECENGNGEDNSLIRAGYGGWLLYTAASAGDLEFVKKLLERDSLLVFGEGEYGVTDILYAAARGRNDDVFYLLLDFALLPADIAGVGGETDEENLTEKQLIVKEEMVKRGVHSAARGGHVAILERLLLARKYDSVLRLKDAYGSTLLHSASSRGQVQVVNYLVTKYDSIMEVKDSHGNTALHVAAYKGHLLVVEALLNKSPPLISVVNDDGDTFLHTEVLGFTAAGFKRLDRQMELLRQLIVGGSFSVDFSEIVNVRNRNGRTVIHLAVMDNLNAVRPDVVEILLKINGVDLNVVDLDGMTAVDLLERQTPRTTVSELLIKRLVAFGGRSNNCGVSVSRWRDESYGFCCSPGTSFEISDSEIFLFTAAATTDQTASAAELSPNRESFDGISVCSSEISTKSQRKRRTGARLKLLLRWAAKREESEKFSGDNNRRVPLREIYSRPKSDYCNEIGNRGRAFPMRTESGDLPSLSVRLKFTEGLMKGVVVQKSPRFVFSPPVVTDFSETSSPAYSSPNHTVSTELERRTPTMKKQRSIMNKYLCFGGAGLSTDASSEKKNASSSPHRRFRHQSFKRVISLVSF